MQPKLRLLKIKFRATLKIRRTDLISVAYQEEIWKSVTANVIQIQSS